jgi:hypothetical protein
LRPTWKKLPRNHLNQVLGKVDYNWYPQNTGSVNRRTVVQVILEINERSYLKIIQKIKSCGIAQVVDHLLGKYKTLSSNTSTTNKKEFSFSFYLLLLDFNLHQRSSFWTELIGILQVCIFPNISKFLAII